jgi:nitrile hydratase
MSDGHDHAHEHDHPTHDRATDVREGPLSHYQMMEIALRELLIEKGIFSAEDVRREVEAMEGRNAGSGAAMVARAWVDPVFKAKLLSDAKSAAADFGFDAGPFRILVMENTKSVHNLIVCTLCSCYPRMLLGLPPAWYKSLAYRSRAVREPRKVLAEFGLTLPDDTVLRVHDSTADMRYMVLPSRPVGTDGWSESRLATLVTRDSLIGVATALAPEAQGNVQIG